MSGITMKYFNKVVVADILVLSGALSLAYAYLIIPADVVVLSSVDQLIMVIGFVAMLAHYLWMLVVVSKLMIGRRRVIWILIIAFTYIIGSYLFYFKVYRPSQVDKKRS